MNTLTLFFFIGAVAALPAQENDAEIIEYVNENDGLGTYKFKFATSNGIEREEEGILKNPGIPEKEAMSVKGSYKFTGSDGLIYTVSFVADENGYQPTVGKDEQSSDIGLDLIRFGA